jgi:hypothetical protein
MAHRHRLTLFLPMDFGPRIVMMLVTISSTRYIIYYIYLLDPIFILFFYRNCFFY